METDTNRLLLKSLQKDILQINSIIHCLSKELKPLFHVRNFFVIMFHLKCHLATLHKSVNSDQIDIISFLGQVSIISSQKLKPVLLNFLDLKSLLTKLESQLISHPRLALPQWNGENIWYMYKSWNSDHLWCQASYMLCYTSPWWKNVCNWTFIKHIISH